MRNFTKKRICIIVTVGVAIALVGSIVFYQDVQKIRSSALEDIQVMYEDEFSKIRSEFNFPELSDVSAEEYYTTILELGDELTISFSKQNVLLGFFTSYNNFWFYKYLNQDWRE